MASVVEKIEVEGGGVPMAVKICPVKASAAGDDSGTLTATDISE